MKKMYISLCIISICNYVHAQDSIGHSNKTKHDLKLDLKGSINKVTTGTNYLFNNNASYQMSRNDFEFNTRMNWVYGESLGRITNRDILWSADGNYYWDDNHHWYNWILLSAQTSYSLNLNHQYQSGTGVAYSVFGDNSTNNWTLKFSNGLTYEQSSLKLSDGSDEDYFTWRNSLRVSVRYNHNKYPKGKGKFKFSVSSYNFWQPSLTDKSDYNISSKTDFSIPIYNNLEFSTSLLYNKINRTGKENLLFTYGVKYSTSFSKN